MKLRITSVSQAEQPGGQKFDVSAIVIAEPSEPGESVQAVPTTYRFAEGVSYAEATAIHATLSDHMTMGTEPVMTGAVVVGGVTPGAPVQRMPL